MSTSLNDTVESSTKSDNTVIPTSGIGSPSMEDVADKVANNTDAKKIDRTSANVADGNVKPAIKIGDESLATPLVNNATVEVLTSGKTVESSTASSPSTPGGLKRPGGTPQLPAQLATATPKTSGSNPPYASNGRTTTQPAYAANAKAAGRASASSTPYFNAMKSKHTTSIAPSSSSQPNKTVATPPPPPSETTRTIQPPPPTIENRNTSPATQSSSSTIVEHAKQKTSSPAHGEHKVAFEHHQPQRTAINTQSGAVPHSDTFTVQDKSIHSPPQDASSAEEDIEEVDTSTATVLPRNYDVVDLMPMLHHSGDSIAATLTQVMVNPSLRNSQSHKKRQNAPSTTATTAPIGRDENFYHRDHNSMHIPIFPQLLAGDDMQSLMNAIAAVATTDQSVEEDEEDDDDDESNVSESPWHSLLNMHGAALSLVENLISKLHALKRHKQLPSKITISNRTSQPKLHAVWIKLRNNVKESTSLYTEIVGDDEGAREACFGVEGVWSCVLDLMETLDLTQTPKSLSRSLSHLVEALHVCCAMCAEMTEYDDTEEEEDEEDDSVEWSGSGSDFDDDDDEEEEEEEDSEEEDDFEEEDDDNDEKDDDDASFSLSDASDISDDLSSVDESEPFAHVDVECWRADATLLREFELLERETRFLQSQTEMYRTMRKLKRSFTDTEREQTQQNLMYQIQVLKEAAAIFEEKRHAYVQQQYTIDELEHLVQTRQRLFQKHWPLLKHNPALLHVFHGVDVAFNEQQREHAERQKALRQTILEQRATQDASRVRDDMKTNKAHRQHRATQAQDPTEQAALAQFNQYMQSVENGLENASWLNADAKQSSTASTAKPSSSNTQLKSKSKKSKPKITSKSKSRTSTRPSSKRLPGLFKTPRQMRL